MTRARWAAIAAYFMMTIGAALAGCRINHNWNNFPLFAGVDLIAAGLLIFYWIRPEKRK